MTSDRENVIFVVILLGTFFIGVLIMMYEQDSILGDRLHFCQINNFTGWNTGSGDQSFYCWRTINDSYEEKTFVEIDGQYFWRMK